jgi:hypothetical protein
MGTVAVTVHALCDACWAAARGDTPPMRFGTPRAETCCACGNPTASGIYTWNEEGLLLTFCPHPRT